MFERTEIAQARAAVIIDLLAALEETGDIPGQQLLQNKAADTVVEQPIVAAVERPHAAEEAGVVDRDHQERQDNRDGRQQKMPCSEANKHPYNGKDCQYCQRAGGDVLAAYGPRRGQPHGQRVRLDRDADNAPAGVGGLNGAAAVAGP